MDDSTTVSGTTVTKEKENKDERIQKQHPNWIWQSLQRKKQNTKATTKERTKEKPKENRGLTHATDVDNQGHYAKDSGEQYTTLDKENKHTPKMPPHNATRNNRVSNKSTHSLTLSNNWHYRQLHHRQATTEVRQSMSSQ